MKTTKKNKDKEKKCTNSIHKTKKINRNEYFCVIVKKIIQNHMAYLAKIFIKRVIF